MGRVVAFEDLGAGAQLGFAERVERRVDRVEKAVQIAVVGFDKQEPGDDLADGMALLQIGQGRDAVVRVVVVRELAEPHGRAVVLDDRLDRAGRVIGGDRLALDHEVELVDRLVMGPDVFEALGRFGVVVERDARRDHVDKGRTLVFDRRLDQRYELRLVAREAAGNQRGAELSAKPTRSIAASVLTGPRRAFEPLSAVAENWPLVRPYTPLFSTM